MSISSSDSWDSERPGDDIAPSGIPRTNLNTVHPELSSSGKVNTRYDDVFWHLWGIFDSRIVENTERSIWLGFKALSEPQETKPSSTPDSTDQLWVATEKTFPALLTWLGKEGHLSDHAEPISKEDRMLMESNRLSRFMRQLSQLEVGPEMLSSIETLRSINDVKTTDMDAARSIIESMSLSSVQAMSDQLPCIEGRGKLQPDQLQWVNFRWNAALNDLKVPKTDGTRTSAVDRHMEHLLSGQETFSKFVGSIDPDEMTISRYNVLKKQLPADEPPPTVLSESS